VFVCTDWTVFVLKPFSRKYIYATFLNTSAILVGFLSDPYC
jgi:hypothetical protein